MSINRQQAGTLYGNGFLLRDKNGNVYKLDGAIQDKLIGLRKENGISRRKAIPIKFSEIGTDYKIIARKPDLTIPITVGGKEIVPIVELAKIASPYSNDEITGVEFDYENEFLTWVNLIKKDRVMYVLEYRNGNFHTELEYDKFLNQIDLFNWLFAHHYATGFDETLIVRATNEYDNNLITRNDGTKI